MHAAQSAAGHEAPLRPAGGIGGIVNPQEGFGEKPANCKKLSHKKQYFSQPV